MALAASGEPVRFLTLTVNPKHSESPYDRLRGLSDAWRTVVKRLRRRYPNAAIEYLAIVEATKAGEPHLHILLRAPFIPQGYLSACMAELIEAPVVDIRKIRNVREVIRYVAKYIAKAPAQFGQAKRYWCSQGWQLPADTHRQEETSYAAPWRIDKRCLGEILTEWIYEGYAPRKLTETTMVGFKVTHFLL